jgi:hypothetical protein
MSEHKTGSLQRSSPWPNGRIYAYLDRPGAPKRNLAWNLGTFSVVALVLAASWLWNLYQLFTKPVSSWLTGFGTLVLLTLILVWAAHFFYTGIMRSINQYPDIQLVQEGLVIHIFGFRSYWLLVPWEDITEIVLAPRLAFWEKPPQPVWVIRASSLSERSAFPPARSVVNWCAARPFGSSFSRGGTHAQKVQDR